MPFKSVLMVTGARQGEDDLKLAANLCEEINAHLSVFVVMLASPPAGGEYAAVMSTAWRREREAEMAGGAKPAERWAVGKRIRDLEVAPDGAIWALEDSTTGGLYRLTPK